MNNTYIPKVSTNKQWYIIDAKNKTLGRLSTEIAKILRGKNQSCYTPFIKSNNYVIVTNAKYIKVSGNKKDQKVYKRHSGRPGGLKVETFEQLQKRLPHKIIEISVKNMLPKGPLGRKTFQQLKVYNNASHPHHSQKPEELHLN